MALSQSRLRTTAPAYTAELQRELSSPGNAAAAMAVQPPPNSMPQFPLPACLVSASLRRNYLLALSFTSNGPSSPAEAVAHGALVCDTAVLKGTRRGMLHSFSPRASGHVPLEGMGCCMGKRGSGLALPTWPGAGYGHPVSAGRGVPAVSCLAMSFQQVFTPGLQHSPQDGQLGEVEMSQDYHCTKACCCSQMCPIFPQIWVFRGAGGLSLAPMGAEGTWDVHVQEPAPVLAWGGTSPATMALPGRGATRLFPAALQGTDCTMSSHRVTPSSRILRGSRSLGSGSYRSRA